MLDVLIIGLTFAYVVLVLPCVSRRRILHPAVIWAPSLVAFVGPLFSTPSMAFTFAMVAFPLVLCAADIAFSRAPDPEMLNHGPFMTLLFVTLADTAYPRDKAEERRNRNHAIGLIPKAPLVAFALVLQYAIHAVFCDFVESSVVLRTFFWASVVFLQVPLFSILSQAFMELAFGISVAPTFDRPLSASSPGDLWSNRWNLLFKSMMHRNVFIPVSHALGGGNGAKAIAATSVFLASGIVHEYFIVVSSPSIVEYLNKFAGHTVLFFVLQCVVASAEVAWHKVPRRPKIPSWLGTVLTYLWFASTAWLFVGPFRSVVLPAYREQFPIVFDCNKY